MKINTFEELRDEWDSQTGNPPYLMESKRWVEVNELKEELYKVCDDVKNLISTHNVKVEDKYLHTLYLGTVNKMLNLIDKSQQVRETKE